MTDEQINQCIAEACGWTDIGECTCCFKLRGYPPEYSAHKKHIPNYFTDLNAMHEAENCLSLDDRNHYIDALGEIYKGSWEFATATSRQRAKAFLRTLGKWNDQSGDATEMEAQK